MQGIVWNTTYSITYCSDRDLGDSVLKCLDQVGGSLSVFDSASVVSVINRAADQAPVDACVREVLLASMRVNRDSRGRFDPTVSPLVTAWGFGRGHTPTADTARIDSLLRFVGMDKCRLRGDTLYKLHPGLQFNFSAIAKGYGCDRVAATLAANGVSDCLVEIGGEITALGRSPRGDAWRVSVDRPVTSDMPVHSQQAVVELPSPCGMATSGNYRNFHRSPDGRAFGHTIDPVSGRPFQSDVLSASVVAPTAMEADALATACMAMTSSEAMAMADSLHRAVMLVLADSSVLMTESFKTLLVQ